MFAVGFFFGSDGTVKYGEMEEERELFRIGMIRSSNGKFSSRVFQFFCEAAPDVRYGDLVIFGSSNNRQFKDYDTVTIEIFKNWMEILQVQRKEDGDEIVYTAKHVDGEEKSFPPGGHYFHHHFGFMMDDIGFMRLGKFNRLTFFVKHHCDEYQLIICGGKMIKEMMETNQQWKIENRKIKNVLMKKEHENLVKSAICRQKENSSETDRLKTKDILDNLVMEWKQMQMLSKTEEKDFPSELDCSQLKALRMVMNEERKLVCIHGPPGTGKTLTLAYAIAYSIYDNKQVIVLSPTEEASKNFESIFRELLLTFRDGEEIARTALLNEKIFEKLMEEDLETEQLEKEIDELREKLKNGNISIEEFKEVEQHKLRVAKQKNSEQVFAKTRVVFSTINSKFAIEAGNVKNFNPTTCFIDDAGQLDESQTWPEVVQNTRIILAGDPISLRPPVKLSPGRYYRHESSLMEIIMERDSEFSCVTLNKQYRSYPSITEWSNRFFYNKEITHQRGLPTLEQKLKNKPMSSLLRKSYDPLVLIDTCYERDEVQREKTWEEAVFTGKEVSYQNQREAEIVLARYMQLFTKSMDPKKIAIITRYSAQKSLILGKFERNFEMWKSKGLKTPDMADVQVNTAEALQGHEFDVVIFSMVRSNPKYDLSITSSEVRALNVALTRAKYHFCLVGNGVMMTRSDWDPIKHFFRMIRDNKCRFPPSFVYEKVVKYDIRSGHHNFGHNFVAFTRKCKDPEMLEYCLHYQRRMEVLERSTFRNKVQAAED